MMTGTVGLVASFINEKYGSRTIFCVNNDVAFFDFMERGANMKYAVTYSYTFDCLFGNTCNCAYYENCEDEELFPLIVKGKSSEDAARKFLSMEYDDEISSEDDFIILNMYESIMDNFVEACCGGDIVLKKYNQDDNVQSLIKEIQVCFDELIRADDTETSTDNRIRTHWECCVDKTREKFGFSKLIDLLTPDEIKEVFIELMLVHTMVIPLRKKRQNEV